LRIELQQRRPAAIHVLAHLLAGNCAQTLEVTVLELDARAATCLDRKAHFDLRSEGRARIRLPFGADLPGNDQALRRLPNAHVSEYDIGSVLVAGVPAAADERLDHRLGDRGRADAVALRPPAVDTRGEYGECLRRGRFDHDRLADRGDLIRAVHGF